MLVVVVLLFAAPSLAFGQARRDVDIEVGAGETLWSLSRRFDVPTKTIRSANSLQSDSLREGQRLHIPGALATARAVAETGGQHVVRDGETFSSIASAAHVGVHALQRVNPGLGERELRAGMTITLPAGARTPPGRTAVATGSQAPPRTRKQRAWIARAERLGLGTTRAASQILAGDFETAWKRLAGRGSHPRTFRWPAPRGWFVRGFGSGRHHGHLAIDIMADMGQRVIAADRGIVAYAGDGIRGYGNMVLILHAGGSATAHAHNSSMLVGPGQRVRRGEVIARVGQTGNAQGPHVHFMWITEGGPYCDPLPLFRPYGRHRDGRHITVQKVTVRGAIPSSIQCRPRPARIDDSATPDNADEDAGDEAGPNAADPPAPTAPTTAAEAPAPTTQETTAP